ncbi:hypothetical protein KY290_007133 [Solanum tuberosum]|uniref:Nodulin-like domain-containing protein n=1 Tax=Solanum tuberosum TaxID=4113 RepID=A0ABQ7W4S4_SOLTU|nr:hypothetical protein KY290_007133 [Solanum tuberosum]
MVHGVWNHVDPISRGCHLHSFANTGALVTCVKNFPESRGAVLGLLKAVISFVFLRTIRIIQVVRIAHELKVFYKFLYMSLVLAGYLMVIIILQKKFDFTRVEYGLSAALVIFLLFLPLGLVIKEEINSWNAKKLALDSISKVKVVTENPKSEAPQLPPPPPSSSAVVTTDQGLDGIVQEKSKSSDVDLKDQEVSVSCWKTVFQPPARGEDFTILQALFSLDMLILFVATICGVGGTLTAIDNLGQIGTSLGTRKFYKSDIYKKFREEAKNDEMEMTLAQNGTSKG